MTGLALWAALAIATAAPCPPAHQLIKDICVYRSPYSNLSPPSGDVGGSVNVRGPKDLGGPPTGLLRPLPAIDLSGQTPARIELGRLLFFDPILSADGTLSCAHCHHPDLGFADGRARAMGLGGVGVGRARSGGAELSRNAPTLWNAAYRGSLFWDGRAADLELQALQPVTNPLEMGNATEGMLRALRGVPAYAPLFRQAFPGSGDSLTRQNVAVALSAFERTLLSFNSRYDRYAAGDAAALSSAELRGLDLVRSLKTRCFECHTTPVFSAPLNKVLGAPDGAGRPFDTGRSGVTGDERERGSFAVVSFRNIALTAPYMHSGALVDLDEVLEFYAAGGGKGKGNDLPNINRHIRGFKLTVAEKADLIAFLQSLTDESAKPAIPKTVPSGLPVVPHLISDIVTRKDPL